MNQEVDVKAVVVSSSGKYPDSDYEDSGDDNDGNGSRIKERLDVRTPVEGNNDRFEIAQMSQEPNKFQSQNKDDKLTQSQLLARMLEAEKNDNEKLGIGSHSRRRGDAEPEQSDGGADVDNDDDGHGMVDESYVSSSIASSTDFYAALEAEK